MNLEQEALDAIEKIVMSVDPDEKDEVLGRIYRLAHAANAAHSCYLVHDSWRDELVRIRKELEWL